MFLRSVLRTLILDMSLQAFFDGLCKAFQIAPSIPGKVAWDGPIEAGMRFSLLIWHLPQSLAEGSKGIIFEDIQILGFYEEEQTGEEVVQYTYNDPVCGKMHDEDLLRDLTFYI